MKCWYCGCEDSKVIDSRSSEDGNSIRRRRECLNCGKRFTTYETIEDTPVLVIKNNGTRQAFDPAKIRNGIIKACEKRPVSSARIEAMVNNVTRTVYNAMDREVPSHVIGELVMEQLKDVDEVAYVRYASVYRQFKDISSFMEELQKLMNSKEENKEENK
ncbi:MAG: transcriptional regulator NrdR [Clostridia bacterium]|nr:transcriptional regulator NrdR [Clostridia bacterium]